MKRTRFCPLDVNYAAVERLYFILFLQEPLIQWALTRWAYIKKCKNLLQEFFFFYRGYKTPQRSRSSHIATSLLGGKNISCFIQCKSWFFFSSSAEGTKIKSIIKGDYTTATNIKRQWYSVYYIKATYIAFAKANIILEKVKKVLLEFLKIVRRFNPVWRLYTFSSSPPLFICQGISLKVLLFF